MLCKKCCVTEKYEKFLIIFHKKKYFFKEIFTRLQNCHENCLYIDIMITYVISLYIIAYYYKCL